MKCFLMQKRLIMVMAIIGLIFSLADPANASPAILSVRGAIKDPLTLSLDDLKSIPSFHINKLPLLKERKDCADKEALIAVADYRGVLLRDILEKSGMKYVRKWEPGVYIRVRNAEGREVVFSFGEIFYSSIGRSVLIAYEKNDKPISGSEGCGELVVATDVRAGRQLTGVQEIIVERVPI